LSPTPILTLLARVYRTRTQLLCLGSTKMYLDNTKHILVGQLGSQRKKKEKQKVVLYYSLQ
jgi:hypothetical protein